MESTQTIKEIDDILDRTLDEFYGEGNKGYELAKKALICNHIRIVREMCYISMTDLIVITALPRTLLYDLQMPLINVGLDLDMDSEIIAGMRKGKICLSLEPSGVHYYMKSAIEDDDDFDFRDSIDNEELSAANEIHERMDNIRHFEKSWMERLHFIGKL